MCFFHINYRNKSYIISVEIFNTLENVVSFIKAFLLGCTLNRDLETYCFLLRGYTAKQDLFVDCRDFNYSRKIRHVSVGTYLRVFFEQTV